MARMLRTLGIAFVVAAASLALAAPAALASQAAVEAIAPFGVDDFTFESMDVDYTLGRAQDGTSTLEVVETFVAVFPEFDQNRGMRRSIPDSYLGAPMKPEFVSITDGEGAPRPAEVDTEDGVFTMTSRADDYVHGAQTYVFTYRLRNVTRHFADTGVDEFYWQVNGLESAQPYGRVTATLHLDADLSDALTGAQACYRGYAESTDPCEIEATAAPDGTTQVRAAASDIAPYQTMTIAVAFEPDTFAGFDSSFLASGWGWAQWISAVGLAGAVTAAGVTRARRLGDGPGRPTIIAEYTPPNDIDALESAVLLGRPTKAIPAEVLEQAVVGSIRIVEGDRKLFGGTKLKAQLVDPSRADGDGRMLLDGLFPTGMPGEEFEFGRSDTRLSTAAQRILRAAERELGRRGLRTSVGAWTRVWPVLLTVALATLVIVFGGLALGGFVRPLLPVGLMTVAVVAIVVVSGIMARKPLTAKGSEVRDHLAGLRVFIEWAEADRIRMLQSPQGAERVPVDTNDPRVMLRLYETLLPYAVVFGQEKEWAERLAVLYGDGNSPGWYAGASGFHAASFSSGISSLSASTASSSSTSGGSSGGGSAGGGGGGGGAGGV
ncbi:DUF2207 domain-containing protein [Microbacterium ulmi]|uniref:DUF2207 domain-containing protein n=1 Tax=Microbacterium ulmi TaxID=179095 RepID=A0A7Y2M260_9MICO|nr:DUF2207 domain-containing protein [Microbacterium ulmi]NII68874.1 putative membrane protein YgcG [Microbacterium ulmi]NNH05130.1 DUF2207 domain-containing protein [Microbacterium ulmi]